MMMMMMMRLSLQHRLSALVLLCLASGATAFLESRLRTVTRPLSRISPLTVNVAKSGGRMIETEEMYQQYVLPEESSKPVLVFFSAPW